MNLANTSQPMSSSENVVAKSVSMVGVGGTRLVGKNGEQTHYFQHTQLGTGHSTHFSGGMNPSANPFHPGWGFSGFSPHHPNQIQDPSQMHYTGSYSVPPGYYRPPLPPVSLPFAIPTYLHNNTVRVAGTAPQNPTTTTQMPQHQYYGVYRSQFTYHETNEIGFPNF